MSRAPSPDAAPVDRSDCTRAGEVLGRAFYGTDQWTALLPDATVRQRKLEQMFTGTVKLTHAAGGIVDRTPDFEAVALWLPPGRSLGLWPFVKSGFASERFAVTPPFPNLRRLTATMRAFDELHRQQMPDPHWYLLALGVDPAFQGRGHGSSLVLWGIERANKHNKAVYLETEADANAGFYLNLGFEVLTEITIETIRPELLSHDPSPGTSQRLINVKRHTLTTGRGNCTASLTTESAWSVYSVPHV